MEKQRGKARYAAGLENLDLILEAAETVLLESGHAALTFRRIADACDLKVGNVSYYFPAKRDLVKALLDRLVQSFSSDFPQIEASDGADARTILTRVMFYWMKDNETRRFSRIYVELWSMANNDAEIRKAIDEVYERGRALFSTILLMINPLLSSEDLSSMALFMISLLEGIMVFANEERADSRLMPRLAAYAVHAIEDLARNGPTDSLMQLSLTWAEAD